ncbi:nuclear pore complex Nup214 isoform X1, partial [Paramuricea clavata]
DFQRKKEIPTPTILQNPSQVSDLVWISTFQFGVAYTECDDSDTSYLIIINSPKNGPTSYEMFDDVYYGMGEDREPCFYLKHLAEW